VRPFHIEDLTEDGPAVVVECLGSAEDLAGEIDFVANGKRRRGS
jgi:hypothetical protein